MEWLTNYTVWQWILVVGSSVLLYAISPLARSPAAFFRGARRERRPGTLALMSSLVISWLFAKSITNAANLGLSFGILGGVAYAGYYLSFAVAGVVIYYMRTRGGFTSIHEFLKSRFGRGAVMTFSLLICFRLFNEVWSNTMVIGSYFGAVGSGSYYISILVFTSLTLAYSLRGGMSSSILTDIVQLVLFGVLLAVILGAILPALDYRITPLLETATPANGGGNTSAGAHNLLLVALLQSLSYPFHDPVLTDRGFLASPRSTLRAFLWAVPLGAVCIVAFSLVGVYGRLLGVEGQAAVEVGKLLGGPVLLVMNFIMITSAASTLDSTFSSFSKLAIVDIKIGGPEPTPRKGRWAMVAITLLGTLPVFLDPAILSATTVSGAMVVGLAPVFCLWWLPAPRLSFYASVGGGLVAGTAYALDAWPARWVMGGGTYADLLSVTVISVVICFVLYLLPRYFGGTDFRRRSVKSTLPQRKATYA
ncbi:sodium:solute symporter [Lewinella sp. JB7]|uniref:sodium:solute symporter family transporter n=1 Tax=Lewinella sp. JB7 TaxID=2962887 RepID=UPI002114D825|nr:sodium:solute symporter [Lewinella sp. JB7]